MGVHNRKTEGEGGLGWRKPYLWAACGFLWLSAVPGEVVAQNVVPRDSLEHLYRSVEAGVRQEFFRVDTAGNASGDYAWNTALLMQSYIVRFQSTGQEMYLRLFESVADKVISMMDNVRGVRGWNGRVNVGWGTRRFWSRELRRSVNVDMPALDLAEDASIALPLLIFAELVYRDNGHLDSFKASAGRYLRTARAVIDFHIASDWNAKESRFFFPKGSPVWADGINVPQNYESIAGSDLLILDELTGEETYSEIARRIALHLKDDMKDVNGIVIWHYWSGKGYSGWASSEELSSHTPSSPGQKGLEDVSHGGLDVQFVWMCYARRFVFPRESVVALTRNFGQRIDQGTYLTRYVDGSGEPHYWHGLRGGFVGWLDLGNLDPSIYGSFYKLFVGGVKPTTDGAYLLLTAKLLAHVSALGGR